MNSTNAYIEVIGKIELFNKFVFCVTWGIVGFCVTAPVPYSYARYYIYDAGERSFYLFYPTWFVINKKKINVSHIEISIYRQCFFFVVCTRYPFHWRTPFGFVVAYISQTVGGNAYYDN